MDKRIAKPGHFPRRHRLRIGPKTFVISIPMVEPDGIPAVTSLTDTEGERSESI